MNEGELKDKIFESWREEFGFVNDQDVKAFRIQRISGNVAYVQHGAAEWSCKLHSRGVKRNSWRRD